MAYPKPEQFPLRGSMNASHDADQFGMAGGLRYDQPVRALPFDVASDLDDVRFDGDEMLRDFGWSLWSTVAGLGSYCWVGEGVVGTAGSRVDLRAVLNGPIAGFYTMSLEWGSGSTPIAGAGGDIASGAATPHASLISMYGHVIATAGGRPVIWDGGVGPLTYISTDTSFKARYLAPFGSRIIAMYCDGDPQKIRWNKSGDLSNTAWSGTGVGYGNLILADVRSDPIDALLGGCQVGSNFAVFRQRSIWRGFNTNNVNQAIGFVPWIDGVGTCAPYSIVNVGKGAAFLGSDFCPYILGPDGGLIPVGWPIMKYLRANLDNTKTDQITSAFDGSRGEWMLLVPALNYAFIFDVNRYFSEQKVIWRKRPISGISLMGNVGAYDTITTYVGPVNKSFWIANGANAYVISPSYTSKSGSAFTGKWWSRPLNKSRLSTLTQLVLFYTSPSPTTITIKTSADGGETIKETKTLTLAATTKQDARVSIGLNTTGPDLRFSIELDQTVLCRITGYSPVVVERGPIDYKTT